MDKADALRARTRTQLAAYDELLQAVFLEMFGDPVLNEKGWEVESLSNLGKLERGVSKYRPRNAPELLGGEYPLIQTGDVSNSKGYISQYTVTYSEFGLQQSKLWPKGTLCITIAANIAKTGILQFDACFPDSIVGFTPNLDKTNSEFIRIWFTFLQKIIEENASAVAQKNINLKVLRQLEVITPPLESQQMFYSISQKIQLKNRNILETKKESDDLFNSLLQRAFRGEL